MSSPSSSLTNSCVLILQTASAQRTHVHSFEWVNGVYSLAFHGKPISELWGITCRTGERAHFNPQPGRPVLDLPNPEG